jgi:hypothetical protein
MASYGGSGNWPPVACHQEEKTMDLTKEEIARYAPYHTMPEFKQGYDD